MIQTSTNQQRIERSTDKNAIHEFHLSVPKGVYAGLRSRRKFFYRTFLALAACVAIGVSGMTMAQHTGNGHLKAIDLSKRDIIEKLDGKNASVTMREVTFEPGQTDSVHRHTGPVFGYVLEGEYEFAMNDEPLKTYNAGETFYEATGGVHRVSRNPSDKTRTRLLAVIVHPRDAKDVTIREQAKQ